MGFLRSDLLPSNATNDEPTRAEDNGVKFDFVDLFELAISLSAGLPILSFVWEARAGPVS